LAIDGLGAIPSGVKGPGIILLTGGAASIIMAIMFALRPLADLYRLLGVDAMADTPPEHEIATQMLWSLAWGIPGVVCFFAGKVILKREAARRRSRPG
jgi:hypothetical protein